MLLEHVYLRVDVSRPFPPTFFFALAGLAPSQLRPEPGTFQLQLVPLVQ